LRKKERRSGSHGPAVMLVRAGGCWGKLGKYGGGARTRTEDVRRGSILFSQRHGRLKARQPARPDLASGIGKVSVSSHRLLDEDHCVVYYVVRNTQTSCNRSEDQNCNWLSANFSTKAFVQKKSLSFKYTHSPLCNILSVH